MGRGAGYSKVELSMMKKLREDNPFLHPAGIASLLQRYGYCTDRKPSDLVKKIRKIDKALYKIPNNDELRKENEGLKKYIKALEKRLRLKAQAMPDEDTLERAKKYDDLLAVTLGKMYRGYNKNGARVPYLETFSILNWLSENEKALYNAQLNVIGLGDINDHQLQLISPEELSGLLVR